ncbi:RES domain-containing protein [Mycobacterium sp. THU-M104]|uniref:RES domain-containing protein n=1 Tax=unclassified Mycobacterium TaxID=2642494 RepID=UPI003B9BF095
MLPWDPSARPGEPGHAVWIPRQHQGRGRHDAPDRYGCLYLAEAPVSAVAEMLAPFRGTGDLHPDFLVRSGRQLALAELELAHNATLIDLDEPAVLVEESLRPSVVATNRRSVTQAYAIAQYERHPTAAGLRWWSALEASWIQITLFDRATADLGVDSVRVLSVGDETVLAAATHLGLA